MNNHNVLDNDIHFLYSQAALAKIYRAQVPLSNSLLPTEGDHMHRAAVAVLILAQHVDVDPTEALLVTLFRGTRKPLTGAHSPLQKRYVQIDNAKSIKVLLSNTSLAGYIDGNISALTQTTPAEKLAADAFMLTTRLEINELAMLSPQLSEHWDRMREETGFYRFHNPVAQLYAEQADAIHPAEFYASAIPDCSGYSNPQCARDIHLLYELGQLARIPRYGSFVDIQNGPSVACHSHRVTMIALVIAHRMGQKDLLREILPTALLHDAPEARTGDPTPLQRPFLEINETKAVEDIFRGTSLEFMIPILHSYVHRTKIQEQITKDSDTVGAHMEMKLLEATNTRISDMWSRDIFQIHSKMFTPSGKELFARAHAISPMAYNSHYRHVANFYPDL